MKDNHTSRMNPRTFLASMLMLIISGHGLAVLARPAAPKLNRTRAARAGKANPQASRIPSPPLRAVETGRFGGQPGAGTIGNMTAPGLSSVQGESAESSNTIDDVEFFVRQHYLDFLNRQADPSGLAFWVNNIMSCGGNQSCIEVKRIDTSAAFFISIEFQQTGFLVYRSYKAAFGNLPGRPVPIKLSELLPDTRVIGQGVVVGAAGWEQLLENHKVAYFNSFVTRARFTSAYPAAMTPAQFVGAVDLNAGGVLSTAERDALVNALTSGAKTRAQVLRAVVEDTDLANREFNKAFVLMQYFGYLRRNADEAPDNNQDGFNFWLAKLNQFSGDFRRAEMVKAFIVAGEYRARFISGEQVLQTTSGAISSGFGKVQLPGVMEIELTANSARPPMTFTLNRVADPTGMGYFRDDLTSEGLPAISTSSFLEVSTPQTVPGFMGLRVRVPDEILANITTGIGPKLYVFVASRTDTEDAGEFMRLDSTYDAATGMLSAPLSGKYFFEAEDSPSRIYPAGSRRPGAVSVSAKIVVSVANITDLKVPVTGTFTTPSSGMVQARVGETINISGTFNVKVPVALQKPTANPFVTDPYGGVHQGIDFRAPDGTPVLAAHSGAVSEIIPDQKVGGFARCNSALPKGGGLVVRIKHPEDDSVSSYAHLLRGSLTVTQGQQVSAGQQIAQADHSGGACAPHLHFSHKYNDQFVNPNNFFSTNPQQFEQDWLSQLSFVVSVNGTPVEDTREDVTARQFTYNTTLDLATLTEIESGKTYPLVISVQTKDGGSMKIYDGKLKVLPTAMRVVLTWDKPDTDVDLHVMDSMGRESWYAELCGIPNGCLDNDDINGFGPETFSLTQFAPGLTYRVFLHYYSDHGNGPTTAKVKVYVDDQLVTEQSVTLGNEQMFTVGTYPQTPPPAPNAFSDAFPENTLMRVKFRPTNDPKVWEYSLPGLPTLQLVRKE